MSIKYHSSRQINHIPITNKDCTIPVILVIGGHDPSGGAGIQADISVITALGCHPVSLITALTIQDTHRLYSYEPISTSLLRRQFLTLVNDIRIDIVKVGMIGSEKILDIVLEMIVMLKKRVNIIYDPLLAAGGGGRMASNLLISRIRRELLPLCYLLTPNSIEACQLCNNTNIKESITILKMLGNHLLLTGGHEEGPSIINRYFSPNKNEYKWEWTRNKEEFHGSGCTLASAIAAIITRKLPIRIVLNLAQIFTQESLRLGFSISNGQKIPLRIKR